MKDGTGSGYTHADHPALASQLYAAYAKAMQARLLASVVGEEGLSETDRKYLAFGKSFEMDLVRQETARHLERSMDIGWDLLRALPKSELSRLSDKQIETYLGAVHERVHPDPQRRHRPQGGTARDAGRVRLPGREVPAARLGHAARLRRYDQAMTSLRALLARAGEALAASVSRHGLQELQCHR